MKWGIWALLVINFGLLGFFQASRWLTAEDADSEAAKPAVEESRIKVLTAEQLAALPRKQPPPEVIKPACYEWGSFAPADAARLKTEIGKLGLAAIAKPHAQDQSVRYWVYVPPLKSAEKAQAKMEELQALGVQDMLIIQDAKWRNAISLGLFREKALADEFVKKLRELGVKNVAKLSKKRGNTEVSLIINNVTSEQATSLQALKPQFSGGELSKVECSNG